MFSLLTKLRYFRETLEINMNRISFFHFSLLFFAALAMTSCAEKKFWDAALAAGKLTAAKATTLKTNLTAHITERVNQVRGPGMGKVKGKGHGMGKGHGRP